MISISDGDKAKLEEAHQLISSIEDHYGPLTFAVKTATLARRNIREVLTSIDRLAQPAPYVEPRIVALSESDLRLAYPERFSE